MSIDRREFIWRSAFGIVALAAPGIAHPFDLTWRLDRTDKPKKILIAGAGLAGLAAGYELVQAGRDVSIIEANTRPGGRVYTLRDQFSDGLYAEAGAGRIPEWHDLTLKYVHEFGLTLEPFYPTAGGTVTVLRGKRAVVPEGKELDLSQVPFDLTPEERRIGPEGLQKKYVDPILAEIGDASATGWPNQSIAAFDRVTWGELLRQRGASAGYAALLLAQTGWEWDSALDFFRDDEGHRGAKHLTKIRGGNDLLPQAFASRLRPQIHYNEPIVQIRQSETEVRVFTKGLSHGVHTGDYLICTLPFSVLRGMDVEPHFPADKREIIGKIYYDPVVRTYAQVRRRFWEADGLNGYGETDTPTEVWQPTFTQPGPRGILHTYLESKVALRAAGLSEEIRTREGIEILNQAFPGLNAEIENAFSFCWGDQPWARGAYVALGTEQISRWGAAIHRPEGRIHFAGEHTSPWPGWMQGAIHSGLRAAREVQEAPAG
jgi:monoamine oxidase